MIKEVIQDMLNKYGEDTQIDVAIEEFAELIKELVKYKRSKVHKREKGSRLSQVLDEIGDVLFMIEYLKVIFNLDEQSIKEAIEEKAKRTKERYL